MPRLRRLKNYDYIAPDEYQSEVEEVNNNDDYSGTERSDESSFTEIGKEDEQSSGSSWLSNAAIISSFSETKLRTALSRYKSIVSLLEAELLARAYITKRHPNEDCTSNKLLYRTSTSGDKRISRRERKNSEVHKIREMRRILRSLSISQDAKRQLFDEWCKIQEANKNGDK